METIILILTLFVALEHLGFLYLEMFLWTKPKGRKTFGLSKQQAEDTKTLAANQGLYNGFLAAGLLWGVLHNNPDFGQQITLFFLSCVLVAGVYGGFTVKKSILVLQALPAAITIALILCC